ncbi:MAG: hypothetical protein ACHQ4G_03215 [Opitutales bacterium]
MIPRRASLCGIVALSALPRADATERGVSVRWEASGGAGTVMVDRGTLVSLHAANGTIQGHTFQLPADESGRLDLTVSSDAEAGAGPVVVAVAQAPRGFAFRLDDVDAAWPIYLPADHVVVTTGADARSYGEIVADIRRRGSQTKLQRIAAAPEASFAAAAAVDREVRVQTWLGLSRDMRLFRVDENLESLQPKFAGYDVPLPETPKQTATYAFQFGRGWGPRESVTRWLDDGDLPILRGVIDDEAIRYDVTLFVTLERSPLTPEHLRGTDFLVADAHGHGHSFTPAQAAREAERSEAEMNPPEEVVLYGRAVATNRGTAPQYALWKTVTPALATPVSPKLPAWQFDAVHGLGQYESGRVFAVSRLDGAPLPAEECSVLLRPGASVVLEFMVPHRPVSRERALALGAQSFDRRLDEARRFWRGKLATGAQWQLPEPRIDRMVQAGLLHLDLVAYGREPREPLLPAIGLYTAIGSESAPIIQFMDSMGWHATAERELDFFLAKQHDDGFMQNFNGYMLETGAVLWTMGEHFRYTADLAWLRRVHPGVTKAWHYLRDWRARNLQPELKGHGYGLLDGKTADPEDPYRSFMLNGYAYLGLARTAEMLRALDPAEAAACGALAAELKADIRTALGEALERSPVVPLGDGTWSRAAPPWTGYRGPVMLHADGGSWFTHGSMAARDSLLGPLYLVFQEVLAPTEPMATELLQTHSELMTRDNVAFSQPYYSRHPWVHLQRGETKAFLQAWYGTVAAMADRGTYTFTEHFFPVSAHKTHEEAWFLMQTRWMLYLEDGPRLRLLTGIPRAYLAPGAHLSVSRAGSYFGPLSFAVTVSADGNEMRVTVDCPEARRPGTVEVRLPHPLGRRAVSVTSGTYDGASETLRLDGFTGHAEAVLHF